MMSFYLAPDYRLFYSVWRIIPEYDDGKPESGGTAFLVSHGNKKLIVTARHVIDPKYRPTSDGRRDATCVAITMIGHVVEKTVGSEQVAIHPSFYRVRTKTWEMDSEDNDLAVLRLATVGDSKIAEFLDSTLTIQFEELADLQYLSSLRPGENVAFIGFPGGAPVYEIPPDERPANNFEYKSALLRQGVVSSPTNHGFSVPGAIGNNYSLLDAFAQNGYSGAPVIALQRGIPSLGISALEEYRSAKIIGVVCAHYRTNEDRADGMHAGLSYFVRSDSIRNLLVQ